MGLSQLIVVVPCYNEEQRLDSPSFVKALEQNPNLHWLFVNDGSKDNTQAIIEDLARQAPDRIFTHNLSRNSGKGEAVRQGLIKALEHKPQFVGYYDADQATPLSEIFRLHEIMTLRHQKVLLGSRVFLLGRDIRRQQWRFWLGRCFAVIASSMLRLPVYDTQCGMKLIEVFPKMQSCLDTPFVSSWLFDVELMQRFLDQGGLKSTDFYEEPLLQWREVGGSKVKAGAFVTALIDLIKIKLKSLGL